MEDRDWRFLSEAVERAPTVRAGTLVLIIGIADFLRESGEDLDVEKFCHDLFNNAEPLADLIADKAKPETRKPPSSWGERGGK